jgi:THO complex subunit 4
LRIRTNITSSAPKSQPKSAAINTNKPGNAKGKAQPKKKDGKRPARPARPAKKTAEELDLEMADYWESGNGATGDNSNNQANMDNGNQAANAAAQPATNGDANMDDEILV